MVCDGSSCGWINGSLVSRWVVGGLVFRLVLGLVLMLVLGLVFGLVSVSGHWYMDGHMDRNQCDYLGQVTGRWLGWGGGVGGGEGRGGGGGAGQ